MKPQYFELTAEHVALARRMNVSWDGAEFGAPGVDPKRPYGNSDVPRDMHEIVTGSALHPNEEISEERRAEMMKLHGEMETALQVILAAGSFEPGSYVADPYRINWRRSW